MELFASLSETEALWPPELFFGGQGASSASACAHFATETACVTNRQWKIEGLTEKCQ
jgi:hypothetical protein